VKRARSIFSWRQEVLALTICLVIVNTAWASVAQLAELTAADGANGDLFGRSVAMIQNTIVVGAPAHDQQVGAAYVFAKPQNGWAHAVQTAKLTASDGQLADFFGSSVAIDGDVIVVGAPGVTVDGIPDHGAVYVFIKPPQGWKDMTQTAKLTVPDAPSFAELGQGVAISGNTVVAGAPESLDSNPGPGAAYLFVEPPGGWTDMSETATLTA
jgi:hypothetical protein